MLNRRVITLLAISFALVLRMAVPGGWMPVANAQGGIVLTPCPAAAPEPVDHGSHHSGATKSGHKGKNGADCSFAPFHAGLNVATKADLPQPRIKPASAAPAPISSTGPATGPPAPPPPARGPPALT